jgi:hypothetical protein
MSAAPFSAGRGKMCEKCVEIDKTIERYRRIRDRVLDEATAAQATRLIAELKDDKAALHPETSEP